KEQLSDVTLIPPTGAVACSVKGTMSVGDRDWEVELRLPRGFPSRLPKVYINRSFAGQVRHVGPDGDLCVLQEEGSAGDYRRPGQLIREVRQRTRRTLTKVVCHPPQAGVLEELEAYCRASSSVKAIPSYFEPGDDVVPLRAGWTGERYVFFSRDDTELDRFYGVAAKRCTQRRAVYVPLKESAADALSLPFPFTQSGEAARNFINEHSSDRRGLRRAWKKDHTLFVL